MSLDYYISAHDTTPPSQLAGAAVPTGRALGPLPEVRAALDAILPGIDWGDPTWGVVRFGEVDISINIADADPCMGFAFHVRGSGEDMDKVFQSLRVAEPNWYVDCAILGEWLHHLGIN